MSKTAEKIAKHLTGKGWAEAIWYFLEGTTIASGYAVLVSEIDAAIEGKIISKSEVDALRKDASNLEDAIDGALYYEKEYFQAKKERDYWRERATNLREQLDESVPKNAFQNAAQCGINQDARATDLASKLWDAEQEIHDLKLVLERFQFANENLNSDLINEIEENDRVTDDWETEVQAKKSEIQHLKDWVADLAEQNTCLLESSASELNKSFNEFFDSIGWKNKYTIFAPLYPDVSSQSEQEKPAETIEPPSCLKPADALNWTSTQVYGGSENNKTADLLKDQVLYAESKNKNWAGYNVRFTSPVLTDICCVKGCTYFGKVHPPVSSQSEQK